MLQSRTLNKELQKESDNEDSNKEEDFVRDSE